jgi:hypothetical protein
VKKFETGKFGTPLALFSDLELRLKICDKLAGSWFRTNSLVGLSIVCNLAQKFGTADGFKPEEKVAEKKMV